MKNFVIMVLLSAVMCCVVAVPVTREWLMDVEGARSAQQYESLRHRELLSISLQAHALEEVIKNVLTDFFPKNAKCDCDNAPPVQCL